MAGVGHLAVGIAAGRVLTREPSVSVSFWRVAVALCTLSLLPDLDVIAFRFGIPYEAPFGHRGASHSMLAALVVAGLCATLPGRGGASRHRVFWVALVVVASHGLLDTLTDGGRGVALWWPVSNARLFAPWRPIPVSPIGLGLLSSRGAYVIGTELAMFAPVLLWGLWPRGRD